MGAHLYTHNYAHIYWQYKLNHTLSSYKTKLVWWVISKPFSNLRIDTVIRKENKLEKMVKKSIYKSSQWRCSLRKGVLGNFAKFTWKHLCQSLFFDKFAGLGPATLLKKRFWHRCFPMNFVKLLRTTFSQSTSGRLLLNLAS